MNLALFDLDNTLLAGDSDFEWAQFLISKGVVDREVQEAKNIEFYEHYKAGTLDIYEFLIFQLAPLTRHPRAELDAWASTLNHDADWCMLSIELQLHANRSQTFAMEYQKVWDRHRSDLGQVIGQLFHKLGRIPPAEPAELAAAFMALSHGLALQRMSTRPDPSGSLIMAFLRGLIANAEREKAG